MRFELPEGVEFILSELAAAGYRADIVGGCVRDTLLCKSPNDYDITTSALPENTKAVFRSERTIDTGIKHGTVTVLIDGAPYEITTYRIDGEYKDARHPVSVSFTPRIEDDLSRRDFTVNAMAYNHADGLTDLFGGVRDLNARMIRTVGEPKARFSEDALRILRAIRFSSVLDFEIEEKTSLAIHDLKETLRAVSAERILSELKKLIAGARAYEVITEYFDVLELVAPEIRGAVLPEKREFDALSAYERTALLFVKAGKDGWLRTAKQLKMDNKTRDFIKDVLGAVIDAPMRDAAEIGEYLIGKSDSAVNAALAVSLSLGLIDTSTEKCVRAVMREELPRGVRELKIGGTDLNALGICGERTGRVLSALLLMVARGALKNEREELLFEATKLV